MILSYLLIAESVLFLHGPEARTMKDFVGDAQVMKHQMKYKDTVLRSWPLQKALHSFEQMYQNVIGQVFRPLLPGEPRPAENSPLAPKFENTLLGDGLRDMVRREDLSINIVACRCGEQSLQWMSEPLDGKDGVEGVGLARERQRVAGFHPDEMPLGPEGDKWPDVNLLRIDRPRTRLFVLENCLGAGGSPAEYPPQSHLIHPERSGVNGTQHDPAELLHLHGFKYYPQKFKHIKATLIRKNG